MATEKEHMYTAEDIKKYLTGMLTPAEMHAIEKAALDDAFLAEAMEGYDITQDSETERHLISLKENFNTGRRSRVVVIKPDKQFPMWKVAAAVLIICSGVAIGLTINNGKSSKTLPVATTQTNLDSLNNTVAVVDNVYTREKSTTLPASPNATIKSAENPVLAQRIPPSRADSSFIYRPGANGKQESIQQAGGGYVENKAKNETDFNAANALPSATQNNPDQFAKNKNTANQSEKESSDLKKMEAGTYRSFIAQVVGPDGTPLPFANINITHDNVGTYADARGNFRLIAADSVLNIDIRSVGYLPRNITLKSNAAQNKIVLAEDDISLKDKTLVQGKISMASKKSRAILIPDSVINAEPADGWNNYDTYITNNLFIPENFLQKKIHGEVELSFEVNHNGSITNLKIDKSLCEDCDKAALRVIKNGPRWKVKNGTKANAKVKVKF